MKKLIAWILLVVTMLGLLAGCKKNEQPDATEPSATAPVEEAAATIDDVIEYLKAIYKDDGAKTPVDYERFGIVRIAGIPFEVVWTADVAEDLVKAVVNDDGTVTIDVNEKCEEDTPYVLTATVTDETGRSVSHSWNYLLPQAVDMVSIVKEAYALKSGESLPYESTLTGKVVAIGSPYSEEYKNITVTIEIEGAEDMPIVCYRLKGEGCDKLAMGDIITVTGTLTNYSGTIEFAAGCTLDALTPGERVEAPEDPKQIVDEAYALGANQGLPYEATLTGVITKIKDPYSSQYDNISVLFTVAGRESKPILAYRLKGNGVKDLDEGDTITVKGFIVNYVGSAGYSTIEYTAGCQLVSYENTGKKFVLPTAAADIVKLAYTLKAGDSLPVEATLTGVITKVNTAYSTQYKNVTVTMVVGDMTQYPIECFRMKGTGADEIGLGDTITVKGILTNYNGKIEFNTGCQLLAWNDTGKDPVEEVPETNTFWKTTLVTDPKAGVAYKMGLTQKNLKGEPVLYFNGGDRTADGYPYYYTTTKDITKAADVYLEEVTGGFRMYILRDGTKYYLRLNQRTDKAESGTQEITATAPAEFYTWDATYNTPVHTAADGKKFFVGTYSTFDTLSASNYSYLASGNFPIQLMIAEEAKSATVEDAIAQLKVECPNGYKDDMSLISSLTVGNDTFTVTWAVECEDNTAAKIEGGKLVLVQKDEAIPYKLIATVTAADGKTGTNTWADEIAVRQIVRAAKALLKDYADTFENGTQLISTYTFEQTEFAVAWAVTPADSEAVKIEGGKLVLTPQDEKVDYELTATLTKGEETAAVTYKGAVAKKSTQLYMPKVAEAPEAGMTYKLFLAQNTLGKSLYFNGKKSGNYLATTEKLEEAVDVTVEAVDGVEGGFRLFFMDGETKTYIKMYEYSSNKVGVALDTNVPAEYMTYNTTYKAIIYTLGDVSYYMGTYNSFNTISASKLSYVNADNVDISQFPLRFATTVPAAYVPVRMDAPVAGATYKFYLEQNNLGKTLYFNGKMDGNYLATTEKPEEAVDVTLEAVEGVEGGFRLFFMDGETKTYIKMYEYDPNKVGVALDTNVPAEYMTYNTTFKTLIYTLGDTPYYMGTYKTYNTISASKLSYMTESNVGTEQFPTYMGKLELKELKPVAVDAPVAGATYKLQLMQNKLGKTLYFNGKKDGNYLATTEKMEEAVDVTVEAVEGVEGGFRLFFMDGETKTYIKMYEYSSNKVGVALDTNVPAEHMTFNTTYKAIIYTLGDVPYYMGTYNNFNTISASKLSYVNADNVDVSQFPLRFVVFEAK